MKGPVSTAVVGIRVLAAQCGGAGILPALGILPNSAIIVTLEP